MDAYKFETTIQQDGVIQLPEMSHFKDREVEVFIILKNPAKELHVEKKQTIDQFLDKWTGSLKGVDPDNAKLQYLTGKYK